MGIGMVARPFDSPSNPWRQLAGEWLARKRTLNWRRRRRLVNCSHLLHFLRRQPSCPPWRLCLSGHLSGREAAGSTREPDSDLSGQSCCEWTDVWRVAWWHSPDLGDQRHAQSIVSSPPSACLAARPATFG